MDIKTDIKQIEPYLAFFCSPVLMGIKAANLFTYPMSDWNTIRLLLTYWNSQLSQFEKYMIPLAIKKNRILFFVYDRPLLERQLAALNIIEFLNHFSYPSGGNSIDKLLYLSERIQSEAQFPHEIGIFLGYPFHDVIGFIKNKGANYQCSGYWKVYFNKQETLRLFHLYTAFRNQFYHKLKDGLTIPQIISLPWN